MSKRSWAILAVSLLLSPGCMVVQLGVTNPIPELSTIAVAPFLNLSSEPNMVVDGRRFALAYQSELQKVPGFEVIPVGVTEQAIIDLNLQLNQAGDLKKLADELNADVVVIGAITDYDPYYPTRLAMTVEWFAEDIECRLANVPLDPAARGEIIKSDLLFRKELFKAKWQQRYHRGRDAIRSRPLDQIKLEGVEHPVTIPPAEFEEVPNLFRGQSPDYPSGTYPLSSPRIQTGIDRSTNWKSNTAIKRWTESPPVAQVRQPVAMDQPRSISRPVRPARPETNLFPYGYSNYRIASQSRKMTTSFEKIQNPLTVSSQGRFEMKKPNEAAIIATEESKPHQDLLVSQTKPAPSSSKPPLLPDATQQKEPAPGAKPPLLPEFMIPSPQTNSVPLQTMPNATRQIADHTKFKRLMTYSRIFDASDSDLLAEWRDSLELSGDQRYGNWVARLSWSENFIRFTARLMIREMLIVHGGEARRRITFKLRKYR